jgi:hypothetical protein
MGLVGGLPREVSYPSGRTSQGWAFMVDRYGGRIKSLHSSELTGNTVVDLIDGSHDEIYVAADHIPAFRSPRQWESGEIS